MDNPKFGKKTCKTMLEPLAHRLKAHQDKSFFLAWTSCRDFSHAKIHTDPPKHSMIFILNEVQVVLRKNQKVEDWMSSRADESLIPESQEPG